MEINRIEHIISNSMKLCIFQQDRAMYSTNHVKLKITLKDIRCLYKFQLLEPRLCLNDWQSRMRGLAYAHRQDQYNTVGPRQAFGLVG